MTFDGFNRGSLAVSSTRYMVLLEHNCPFKILKPKDSLISEDAKEKAGILAQMKDMKNSDYKNKGLWFRMTVVHGSQKASCERRMRDFENLRAAFLRAFPGCFVPRIVINELSLVASNLNLYSELPSSFMDKRRDIISVKAIEGFCEKLKYCEHLLESGKHHSLLIPHSRCLKTIP